MITLMGIERFTMLLRTAVLIYGLFMPCFCVVVLPAEPVLKRFKMYKNPYSRITSMRELGEALLLLVLFFGLGTLAFVMAKTLWSFPAVVSFYEEMIANMIRLMTN